MKIDSLFPGVKEIGIPLLLSVLAGLLLAPPGVFAQGTLTPPGAPAPTMKTLTQVEPRAPISSLPFNITVPGAYYLVTNLTSAGGGITIFTDGVTVDLMGFELAGGPGYGVSVGGGGVHTNICVRNGTIRGWSSDGVNLFGHRAVVVENVRAVKNVGNGMTVGDGAVVKNCVASFNVIQGIVGGDGTTGFETVGQLELGDFRADPGETVRFEYTFPGQYVPHTWYRVVPVAPMTNPDTGQAEIVRGTPSDAISEDGRTADPVDVPNGATVTIVLSVTDLPVPITNLNCARVIYPAGYEYVKGSANAGSPGGAADALDGIWSSFATTLLMPPDAMIKTRDYGGGMLATDFNVSVLEKALPAAPAGYGDLLNFKLKQTGSAPLTIGFQTVSDDSVKRTYYSSQDGTEYYFGNSLSYSISVGAGTAGQQAETNGN